MTSISLIFNRSSFKSLLLPLSKVKEDPQLSVNLELDNNTLFLICPLHSYSSVYKGYLKLTPPNHVSGSFKITLSLKSLQKLYQLVIGEPDPDILFIYSPNLNKVRVTSPPRVSKTYTSPKLDITLSPIVTSNMSKNIDYFNGLKYSNFTISLNSLIHYLEKANILDNIINFKVVLTLPNPTLEFIVKGFNLHEECSLPITLLEGHPSLEQFYSSYYDYTLLKPLLNSLIGIGCYTSYLQFGNNTPLKLDFINPELNIGGQFILAPRIENKYLKKDQ